MHEPLVHRTQLTSPRPDLSKNPTHDNINDRPAHPSPQRPLQY
ncbi:hypothetical protein [Actinacidiphila rubida]|nr:hypothetical protein [Actinacidiphila rubida]